jgi:glutaredoxin
MYTHKLSVDEVIPWGKTFDEYKHFFNLHDTDLDKTIACFGDGASSFNSELTQQEKKVISFDPIYQFNAIELEKRFLHTLAEFKLQINYERCSEDSMAKEVVLLRETATKRFLSDFELGKKQNRFINHMLPDKISFENDYFDLGLSSHFLLMYDYLGVDFHIESISEMMRVCKEVRIFPTINLHGRESGVLHQLIEYLEKNQFIVEFLSVNYKFNSQGRDILKVNKLN